MKMHRFAAAILAILALPLFAQESSEIAPLTGRRYSIVSERGPEQATALLGRLEALFDLYNGFFRFDESALPGTLRVREFKSRESFDAYLKKAAGETRADFVYLHYKSPERRELLIFPKEEPEFGKSLSHQAFVQFLKAFVQNPPLWMRDGFAVLFETARWNGSAGQIELPENLGWLESVKALSARGSLIPIDKLIVMGNDEARAAKDVFYPQSWALVSFLLLGGESYGRLLWEGIATLKPEGSLEENQKSFLKRMEQWYGSEPANKDFLAYLDNRKTFPELVVMGIEAYGAKDYDGSMLRFEEALELDPASFVPAYYLGLIAYAKAQFAQADGWYQKALTLGCDPAVANYALGLSALAQGKNAEAATALNAAAKASPERYKAKVDELLMRLKK